MCFLQEKHVQNLPVCNEFCGHLSIDFGVMMCICMHYDIIMLVCVNYDPISDIKLW